MSARQGTFNRRQFLKTSASVPLISGIVTQTEKSKTLSHTFDGYDLEIEKIEENEKIKEARQVALKILKPSRKELEHGMELHKNSIVIEPYGFSPRSALDGTKIRAVIEAGASEAEIQDLTEDMRMTRCVTDPVERQEYLMAWKASGVTCVFQNAGEEGNDIRRLIKRLARFTFVTDTMRDFVSKAITPEDIIAAKKQNTHCLYLSGNGVPMPQDWVSLEEELRYIRVFFQLGIRMMHLTYNRRNMIGDGCAEHANGGLSDFGREVIAEMNRVGIIVDIAHSSWQTSLEAAKASQRPVVASHTVCNSVNDHIRAKPDNVIKAIADTGGFIGICCVPRFLGGSGDIDVMMDHLDYAIKTFGADHVAIATDVAYESRTANREWEKIPEHRKTRAQWEQLWPPDDFVTKREMRLSMAWTNWPLFTVGLVQRGYSDNDIQKIIGGNALRVARTVIPEI